MSTVLHMSEMLQDLESLVRCESPSDDLDSCKKVIDLANEIARRVLGKSGKVREHNGRPLFWWGDQNPKILLLTHLDTVWPIGSFDPQWSIEGDMARGPGIFDMKAGFIQALYAMREINGSVALLATTDEEIGSNASKDLIQNLAKSAEAVLVFEASLDGKVKTGRKGSAMYQIKVHGKAAHAGLEPEKGINATLEIAHQILALQKLASNEHGTTVVPTILKSGTTNNTVPDFAILEIDVRSFNQSELERVDRAIKSLQVNESGAKLEITGGIHRPVLEESSAKELYEIAERVAEQIGMAPLGSAKVGGVSDGNFAAAVGAKVLDGLGAIGDGAHSRSEWISIKGLQERTKLVHAFIKELLK